MRPQSRPVIVEVKRKRDSRDRRLSIWGGVDLSKAIAEADADEQQNNRPVDSGAHGAIGHKVPISLLNPDGATSPPS